MLLNVEEGKALMQTWHRARPSSEKVNLHLEKARKEAAKSSSSKAATKGPFKGWNSRKSLEEVIGIITDVEQASEGVSLVSSYLVSYRISSRRR
jgi:hypothetical protein